MVTGVLDLTPGVSELISGFRRGLCVFMTRVLTWRLPKKLRYIDEPDTHVSTVVEWTVLAVQKNFCVWQQPHGRLVLSMNTEISV